MTGLCEPGRAPEPLRWIRRSSAGRGPPRRGYRTCRRPHCSPRPGRFVRGTLFREAGEKISEISSPEAGHGPDSTSGEEVRALLATVDPSTANPAWTTFAPRDVLPLPEGSQAINLEKASA